MPARPADPKFPSAGELIKDLTLAQIKTLDCGFGVNGIISDDVDLLILAATRNGLR